MPVKNTISVTLMSSQEDINLSQENLNDHHGLRHSPSRRFRRIRTWPAALAIATDCLVIAVSLGHLILVCLVASCDTKRIDENYFRYQSLLTALAPLFPLIFAFIIGRLLSQASRLRLENGATVGLLEQLMGSRTLGGALETHLEMRKFNLLSLMLFGIWAFSPLGGQSLLRVLSSKSQLINTEVGYMDISKKSLIPLSMFLVKSSFGSALFSPQHTIQAPADPWGNVKVPFLPPTMSTSSSDWVEMNDSSPKVYSSLIGIPVKNLSAGNSTFNLESSYLDLSCAPGIKHPVQQYNGSTLPSETILNGAAIESDSLEAPKNLMNGTWYGNQHGRNESYFIPWNVAIDHFMIPRWWSSEKYRFPTLGAFENDTSIEAEPTNLLFQVRRSLTGEESSTMASAELFQAQCLAQQRYVESRIECSRLSSSDSSRPNCMVVAQRPSQKPHLTENLLLINHPWAFYYLSSVLPAISGPESGRFSDPILSYIHGEALDEFGVQRVPDFTSISAEKLSTGLGQVLNSLLNTIQLGYYINPRFSKSDEINNFLPTREMEIWQTSPADTTDLVHVYAISWLWMSFCIVSCVILVAASILGVTLSHLCKGPEVLGTVTTAIRDSKHIDIIPSDGHMGGYELARIWWNEKIRYGYTGAVTRNTKEMGIGRAANIAGI